MSTGFVLEAKREYFDPAPCRILTPDSSRSSPLQSHIHHHLKHHHHHHLNTDHDRLELNGVRRPTASILGGQPADGMAELLVQHLVRGPAAVGLSKQGPASELSCHGSPESVRSRESSPSAAQEAEDQRPPVQAPHDDDWRSIPLHVDEQQGPDQPACSQAAPSGGILMSELRDTTAPEMSELKAKADDARRDSSQPVARGRLSFQQQQQTSETAGHKSANLNLEAKLCKIAKFETDEKDRDRQPGDDEKMRERRRRKSSQCSRLSISSSKAQIGYRKPPFMFAGISASILGSVFFSLSVLTIKLLPDGQGLAEKTQIALSRGLIMGVLCAGAILKSGCSFLVPRDEILINVLRSVFGFFGIYMSYIALKYISMGDATALVFSSPVWTSILSHYILHEPLQWIQLLALPLSMLGIVLIAHPSLIINMEHKSGSLERQPLLDPVELQLTNATSANVNSSSSFLVDEAQLLNQDLDIAMNTSEHFDVEHRWKGIVVALGCSFVVSLVYIVLKFRKSTPIQVATFWLALTTVVFSLIMGSFTGLGELPTEPRNLGLLLLNGAASWLGQCLLQWALMYENASVLSVVRTLDVAMSFSLSAIFLEEEILWTSILGAAIIASVVVSIVLSGYVQSRLCAGSSVLEVDGAELEAGHDGGSNQDHSNTERRLNSTDAEPNQMERRPTFVRRYL